jgi:hypothetical protein
MSSRRLSLWLAKLLKVLSIFSTKYTSEKGIFNKKFYLKVETPLKWEYVITWRLLNISYFVDIRSKNIPGRIRRLKLLFPEAGIPSYVVISLY